MKDELDPTWEPLLEMERELPTVDPQIANDLWSQLDVDLFGGGGGPPSDGGADPGGGSALSPQAGIGRLAQWTASSPLWLTVGAIVGASLMWIAAPFVGSTPRSPVTSEETTVRPVSQRVELRAIEPPPADRAPDPEVRNNLQADPTRSAVQLAPPGPTSRRARRSHPPAEEQPEAANRDEDATRYERSLLARAHSALARQHGREALVALDEHASLYPTSPFAEERAALRVRALFAAGRTAEARRAGTAFLDRYPTSLLRDVVEGLTRGE